MLKKRGDVFYIGFDESNHGRFPEIFVAVASFNYQDPLICKGFEKIKEETKLFSSMKIRDYRYLVLSESDYKKYVSRDIMPIVCSKLINDFNEDYDFLKVYIDGEVRSKQKEMLERLILEREEFPVQSISIKQVPKGEKRETNNLISLADGWANWIYRKNKRQKFTEGMMKRKIEF